ncbi:hypothetical protein [Citrobacter amalonaticus]|uniref:hypothetical protein n=1 Tax=Citrobacter amalonaticus TaxID=35703 RepID=UPI0015E17AF7|nr:hypothetical protein [Citrobacter amalonaticus]
MDNHANKKPADAEKISRVILTEKKISQHLLAYGKITLQVTVKRFFWQLNVPAAQN